ncbi:hypothetical protein B0H15DRAFT_507546 [Mycena belliarum]|uniref:Uncharacterized protein n=1 Tax=Mycena belliarum TaxID=1033014 RepID=A0AAD6XSG9_9AGAR|nr:hypothetical protein B0H15DRAFT_507546 [Mycena belliae]
MPEPTPVPVGATPTTRSGAIYKSADELCILIEAETAHAIQPYTKALDDMAKEFLSIRDVLQKNGLGVFTDGTRIALRFVGSRATIVAKVDEQVLRFAPDPSKYKPISPSSIVDVLVQCLHDCSNRLDEGRTAFAGVLKEREELSQMLVQRIAECLKLKEEQDKVAAQLKTIQIDKQTLSLRFLSAQNKSNEWKAKFHAAETERDTLKTALEATDSVQVDSDDWQARYETDLKAANDRSHSLQTELDSWKTKYEALIKATNGQSQSLQAEAERWSVYEANLKAEKDKALSLQTTADEWEAKCRIAETDLKTATEYKSSIEADMEVWKARSLLADAEREKAQSALRDAQAKLKEQSDSISQWATKAASWETERTRQKTQTARNAALISQLQATDIPLLKTQLHDAEAERDRLKAAHETEKAQALASYTALKSELEDVKKKAATNAPKPPPGMFIKARTPAQRPVTSQPTRQGSSPSSSPHVPVSITAASVALASSRSFSHPMTSASSSSAPAPSEPSVASPLPPVKGLQAGMPLRRAPAGSSTVLPSSRTPAKPKPDQHPLRAPPLIPTTSTSTREPPEVLRGAAAITRTKAQPPRPASTSKEPPAADICGSATITSQRPISAQDSPHSSSTSPTPTPRRPALASQSNAVVATTTKSTDTPLKRTAPSPLPTERSPKTPRTSDTPPRPKGFTKPPTLIMPPSRTPRT